MAEKSYQHRNVQQTSSHNTSQRQTNGQYLDDKRESSKQLQQLASIMSARCNEQRQLLPQTNKNSVQEKFSNQTTAQLKSKPNHTSLPDNLKTGIEALSGISMDNVKVHYNSDSSAQLNALAYTQGMDIHIAPGQEKHLPHEAWHVVQQGRVKPTLQMKKGVLINNDKALEKEADAMGNTALQTNINATVIHSVPLTNRSNTEILQLAKNNDGDSAKLGRERWKLKTKATKKLKGNFKQWKKGREAQHLIPAAVCAEYGISEDLVNSGENGMMIPSGRPKTHGSRNVSLDKNKVFHIKKGLAHPVYNKTVSNYCKKMGWVKGNVTKQEFSDVTAKLRLLHKNKRDKKWTYVDDITVS